MVIRGHNSSCAVAMSGASQPQRSCSQSNSAMSMQLQYPAAAPAAAALQRQQSHASWVQGQPQSPRPSQPTKTPQEPHQNTKSRFPEAQRLPLAKQHQGQQKQQQPLLHRQQLHSRVSANRLTVKPVT